MATEGGRWITPISGWIARRLATVIWSSRQGAVFVRDGCADADYVTSAAAAFAADDHDDDVVQAISTPVLLNLK